MIQIATKTFWEEQRHRTPQTPNGSFGKIVEPLGESLIGLAFGSKDLVASRVGCDGLQFCGCQDFVKDVEGSDWGSRLALPGPMGQCASARSIHLLECLRESRWLSRAKCRASQWSLRKRSRRAR